MRKRYKAAIVGCGFIAGLRDHPNQPTKLKKTLSHAAMYHSSSRTDLVAAVDVDERRLHEFSKIWEIPYSFSHLEEMISEISPDIVSICTPGNTHSDVVQILGYSPVRAIFCEKPLAYDVRTARYICKAVQNKIFYMNFFRSWDSAIQIVKSELNHGIRGRISTAIFHHSLGIRENACHVVDILLNLFGYPLRVEILRVKGREGKDYLCDFLFEYDDFNAYVLENRKVSGNYFNLEILTDNGKYQSEDNGLSMFWHPFEDSGLFPGIKWISAERIRIESTILTAMSKILDRIITDLDKGNTKSREEHYLNIIEITELLYKGAEKKYEKQISNFWRA